MLGVWIITTPTMSSVGSTQKCVPYAPSQPKLPVPFTFVEQHLTEPQVVDRGAHVSIDAIAGNVTQASSSTGTAAHAVQ